MAGYDHKEIERNAREKWAGLNLYETDLKDESKEPYYLLVEFPYPSGDLHIGHWYAFAVTDIYARVLRMRGKNVLFPIGFDAFGLPAENAAIKNGVQRRQHLGRNDGGDGVGGIMETVDEIEHQRQDHDQGEKKERDAHAHPPFVSSRRRRDLRFIPTFADPSASLRDDTFGTWGWDERICTGLPMLQYNLQRDRTGITQVVLDKDLAPAGHGKAEHVRPEYVVAAKGTLRRRDANAINPKMPTGEVELAATELLVLNDSRVPPFSPAELPVNELCWMLTAAPLLNVATPPPSE